MTASRPALGIVFMCLATTLFPFMNGLVQVLSERYSSEQIIWARITSHLVFVLALFMPSAGWRIFSTDQLGWQLSRSATQLASTSIYFFSVKHLPLAQAASISFTTPFMVTLLALPILGERIGLTRLLTLAVGFIGVLTVIRPGSAAFHWATVGVVASSACYALYQIFTRRVAGRDRAETSVVYSALGGAIVMSVIMPFVWKTPESWRDVGLMCALGIFGGLGHYCVARAMSYAPASVVSPFMYWQMVGSVVIGYLISGTLPDLFTWLGTAIIVGAGLHMGWRETREKAVGTPAPARAAVRM